MNRRNLLHMMGAAAIVPFVTEPMLNAATTTAEGEPGEVFELRTYTCFPGKLPALLDRFRTYEAKIFARLGMPGVGFWTLTDEPGKNDKLVYMLRHKSRKQADEDWAKFRADPEWVKVKAESEKDGALVDKHEIVFLALMDFSPKL